MSRLYGLGNVFGSRTKKPPAARKRKNRRPQAVTAPESLERRAMLAAFNYDSVLGSLTIDLDNANEEITLASGGGGNYVFTSNNSFTGIDSAGEIAGATTNTLTITIPTLSLIQITDSIIDTKATFGVSAGAYTATLDIVLDNLGGTINVAKASQFDGPVSLTAAAGISLGGDVTTDGKNVTFSSATKLTDSVAIDTGAFAGNITFSGTLDGTTAVAEALTLTAGFGNVKFTGAVGATTRLGAIEITSAKNVTANAIKAASLKQTAGSETTTLNGAVDTDALAGVSLTGTKLLVNNSVTTAGGGVVTFIQSDTITIAAAGDITAAGAVSLTATNGITTAGDITTVGKNITFASKTTLSNAITLSTGPGAGSIAFSSTLDGTTDALEALTLDAGTGNITFTGAVGGTTRLGAVAIQSAKNVTANAFTAKSLTQAAGTGTTTLNGAVDTDDAAGVSLAGTNLVVNNTITTVGDGTVTFNQSGTTTIAAAGVISSDGAVNLAATGGITTAGDITTTGDNVSVSKTTLSGPIAIDTGVGLGNITFSGSLDGKAAGAQVLSLTAGIGNITFSGLVGNTAALGAITLNSAANVTANGIRATSLAQITGSGTTTLNGGTFTSAPAGTEAVRTTGAAGVSLFGQNLAVNHAITTTGGGTVTFDQDGTIAINATGDIFSDAAVTLKAVGGITTAGDITTTDDNVTFLSKAGLSAAVGIDTGAGAGEITFDSEVDGPGSLTLAAGTGNISFAGIVGGTTPVGAITITSANDVTAIAIKAASLTQTAGAGTTTLNGPVETSAAAGVSLTGTNLEVNDTITTTGGGPVTFTQSGTITILAAGDINSGGAVSLNAAGGITTAGDITTIGKNVTFGSATELSGAVTIATGAGGGDITFSNTLDGTKALTLTAGTGNITFTGAVGDLTPLGAITITSAGNVTANAITAASLKQQAGTGTTTLSGPVTTSVAAGVSLTGTNLLVKNSITTTSGGTVTFDQSGTITILAAGDIDSDGAVSLEAAGGITTAGDITTTNDNVTFVSKTVLSEAVAIDTGAGGGDIDFLDTLNGSNVLTLAAGTGDITFADPVGGNTRLGAITITSAKNVTAVDITAASLTQVGGSGTTTLNGPVDTDTVAGVSLTGKNLVVNATITTTGDGTVTFDQSGKITITLGSAIDSDGAVTLTAADGIETAGNVTTSKDNVTFVSKTVLTGPITINTKAGPGDITFGDTLDGPFALSLVAGTGNILFAGVVGDDDPGELPLGAITIFSATDVEANGLRIQSLRQLSGSGTTTLNGGPFTSLLPNPPGPGTWAVLTFDDLVGVPPTGVSLTGNNLVVNHVVQTLNGGPVIVNMSGAINVAPPDGAIVSSGPVLLSSVGDVIGPGLIQSNGDITITSVSGSILFAPTSLLHSINGSVVLTAVAGTITVDQIEAFANVRLDADQFLNVFGSVTSNQGDILLTSTNRDIVSFPADPALGSRGALFHAINGTVTAVSLAGAVSVHQAQALEEIVVSGVQGVTVTNELRSETAEVTVTALAGPIAINGDIFAETFVALTAAQTISLTGLIQATTGDVTLTSTSVNIELATGSLIHAMAGKIDLDADCGEVIVDRLCAFDDIIITAPQGVTVNNELRSETASISVTAAAGPATLRNFFAESEITVEIGQSTFFSGYVKTTSGSIDVTSGGTVSVDGQFVSGDEIRIAAALGINDFAAGGVIRPIRMVTTGAFYEFALVEIAPPARGGGRAATARAVLAPIDINPTTGVVSGGQIIRIELVDSGFGYEPGERPQVTITGSPARTFEFQPAPGLLAVPPDSITITIPAGAGATALASVSADPSVMISKNEIRLLATGDIAMGALMEAANGDIEVASTSGSVSLSGVVHAIEKAIKIDALVGSASARSLFAGEGITLAAGKDVTLIDVVRSNTGDVSITSIDGDLNLNAAGQLVHAVEGSIALESKAGGATVQQLTAGDNIAVRSLLDIQVLGAVDSAGGNITLTATSGDIVVDGKAHVHALAGGISVATDAGTVRLTNAVADNSITVNADGDITLSDIVHSRKGDVTAITAGKVDVGARVTAGQSIALDAGLSITSLGGGIESLELLSGGVNYEWAIVEISPPSSGAGRAAIARAIVANGSVTSLELVDPGFGYAPGEQVTVKILGNIEERRGINTTPAGDGATAIARASSAVSLLHAQKNVTLNAVTEIELGTPLIADTGSVTLTSVIDRVRVANVRAGEDIDIEAEKTIRFGSVIRAEGGSITATSNAGGIDVFGTILAPAGGVSLTAASEVVQRGGSVTRDKLYLLSGGRGYSYALLVISPPPGAGQPALGRAIITFNENLTGDEGPPRGFISDIVLLDPGWGYPSDTRVTVQVFGDGEGAEIVLGTDILTSSVEAKNDVSIQAGSDITLVSKVRSADGSLSIGNTLGNIAIESLTAGTNINLKSDRGTVTLVSVAAGKNVTIGGQQGVVVTKSLNSEAGNIKITTTNGDLAFVNPTTFTGNVFDATAGGFANIEPTATIATKDGSITLASDNGSVISPFVMHATGNISVSSHTELSLVNTIRSSGGNVTATSTAGRILLTANVVADAGDITLNASNRLTQEVNSGLTKIELLSAGPMLRVPPDVTVSIAGPVNGGLAAEAIAIIDRRPIPTFANEDGGDDDDEVLEYEYFIASIAIVNPGRGYEVGEQPRVTITGVAGDTPVRGATARAFGPTFAQMLTAGKNISLFAGENMTLVTKIYSADGLINIRSITGDMDLSADTLLVTSQKGSINVVAERGTLSLQQFAANQDVTVFALDGIDVLQSVYAEIGSISLTSWNGPVLARHINAGKNVAVESFRSVTLDQEIAAKTGNISVTSLSGGIFLDANVVAEAGSVTLASQNFVHQLAGTGIERINIVARGVARDARPNVTITIAPPRNGGRAAQAEAIVGERNIGRVDTGDGDNFEYFIAGIEIIDAGEGYALGENPLVTVESDGLQSAILTAVGPQNLQPITAFGDVSISTVGHVDLIHRVTSLAGSISIRATSGDIKLAGRATVIDPTDTEPSPTDGVFTRHLIHAVQGKVLLETLGGGIEYQRIIAAEDITMRSHETLTINNPLTTNGGDVSLASTGNSVALTANVLAADTLAITAKTGINQTAGLVKAENLTLDNLTATPIVMANGGNDVERFAAKNVGAVTFADTNGFRVGLSSVGPMGVEVSGSTVNLSAGGTIRVVAGIATQGLTITASSVEYVTTNAGDNSGQPFAGTLRDMIAVSNQNLDRQTPQGLVFDEQLVDGIGNPLPAVGTITVGTASLPAFTRPITFDGSRVLATAPGQRLGLLGRAGLPSGLHLGLGSSGSRVTGAAVFGFTTGSGVIVESSNNTVDNMYVGLRPNGVTVAPNRLGVNVSGVRANSNTIGTVMYNSLTDGVVTTLRVTNRGERAAGSTPNVTVTIAPPVGGGTAATAQAVVEEIRPGLYGLTRLVLTNPGSGYEIGENPRITFVGMPGATANSIVAIQTKANHLTGNSDAAIVVQRGASNNLIAGNVVGVPGRTPNRTGVRIDGGSGNQVGTAAQTTDDLTPTPSNLIRGNTHYGVEIRNVRGATTVVENNIVAHNAVREGQGVHGVGVLNSMNVRIGGVSELAANQIHSQRFGGGVHLSGSTNVAIVGNHIGTDGYHLTANGHFPDAVPVWPDMGGGLGNSPFMGNGRHGIDVFGRSRDVEITANRIVDNRGSGVAIASGSSGVVLTRNEIGAWVHPVTGTIHAAGNLADGVTITAANGNTVGSGNVIGFNKGSGVHVENSVAAGLATGNRVAGAEIFGNSGHGVNVSGSSRQTIGGAGGDDGNIIKENLLDGIRLGADPRVRASAAPHGNLVSGNFVGTNDNEEIDRTWGNRNGISVIDGVSNVLSRNTVMNNRDYGIEIAGGVGNTVGGQTTNEGNFIGYNLSDGVFIHDNASTRRDVGVTGTVITAQGAGYAASRTNVIFTAPAVEGGVPARGVAIVSADGRVTGIRLTSSGSGYTMSEAVSVTIFDPLATTSATATVTLGTIQAVSSISRGHVVSGNEIEANAGAGVHVMGDRTTEVQVGQNPDNLRSIGAANKISFHHLGVLVNAAMRTRVQGNVYGDNDSPLEFINGANDRMHGTQTEVLDLRSTQMGIGQTLVTGELVNGGAFHQYSIDVYDTPYWDISYDSNGSPSGHQMRRFLGRALVTTDGLGRATISMTTSQAMELGDYVSVKVTSTRYEPGTTVGVFHSEHRHRTPLLPTPSPSNPTPTPTPGTATPPSGSSGTTGQIPTPPRGSVPPSRL